MNKLAEEEKRKNINTESAIHCVTKLTLNE